MRKKLQTVFELYPLCPHTSSPTHSTTSPSLTSRFSRGETLNTFLPAHLTACASILVRHILPSPAPLTGCKIPLHSLPTGRPLGLPGSVVTKRYGGGVAGRRSAGSVCHVLAHPCIIFAGTIFSFIYYLCKFLFKNENYPKSRR